MLTIKYKIELPNLKEKEEELVKDYYNSWFYNVYNINLNQFFIPKSEYEKTSTMESLMLFYDFSRYLKQVLTQKEFESISFELISIVENEDAIISDHFNLSCSPSLIFIKHILFKGVYTLSYQLMEDINTIKFKEEKV